MTWLHVLSLFLGGFLAAFLAAWYFLRRIAGEAAEERLELTETRSVRL